MDTINHTMDDSVSKEINSDLVKSNNQADDCGKENDPVRNFMNAKIELSMVIQSLSQIAHKYLRTFEVNEEDEVALEDKIARLRDATEKGKTLLDLLNDTFKDDLSSLHSEMTIKIEPVVDGDLSIDQKSLPPSPQSEDAEKNGDADDQNFVGKALKCHKKTTHKDTKKSHSCDICSKSFSTKHNLKVHTEVHIDDKLYQCEICQKAFSSERSLKSHKRIHENPLNCDLCPKSFITSGELESHKRYHTGEKPFMCDQCPKAFSQRLNLINHKRFHDKPRYQCDVENCSKSFVMKGDLERHNRIHTGVKPYCCELCGKAYADLASLKYHKERIHSICPPDSLPLALKQRFLCDKCDKSFPRPQNLKVHQRKHTGEKPYQCEQCLKSFSLKQGLKRHILNIHTGNEIAKSFFCDQCDHACKTKWLLQQHIDARHDATRYNCEVCDFTTTQRRLIHRHNKLYHKDIKGIGNRYLYNKVGRPLNDEQGEDLQEQTPNVIKNVEVLKNEFFQSD